MKTNLENYEERFVDYVEGQLDPAEMREVEDFVAQHPELEEDFKLFGISKLEPDNTIIYPHKAVLLQRSNGNRIPLFVKFASAAAAIALLIGIGFLFLKTKQEPVHQDLNLISIITPRKALRIENSKEFDQLKNTTLKYNIISDRVIEKVEPKATAYLEPISNLESIKSSTISWNHPTTDEDMANLLDMELDNRLATLAPFSDSEEEQEDSFFENGGGLVNALQDHLRGKTMTLYKRTAKTIMTAYYTADCYISETRERLTESIGR